MQGCLHSVHSPSASLFAGRGAHQRSCDQPLQQPRPHAKLARLQRHRRQLSACTAQTPGQQNPESTASHAGTSVPTAAQSAAQIIRCFNGPELPNGDNNGRGRKPLPTQGDAVVEGPGEGFGTAVAARDDDGPLKGSGDLDYLAVSICGSPRLDSLIVPSASYGWPCHVADTVHA